eukprot:6474_1
MPARYQLKHSLFCNIYIFGYICCSVNIQSVIYSHNMVEVVDLFFIMRLLWRFYFVEDLWYFMIAALVNGVGDFVLLTFKQLFIDHIFFLFRFSDVIWMYIMHVIFIVWYNFILSWIHYDVAFENVKKFIIMILVSFQHFSIAALVKRHGDFILLAFKELFSEFGASVGIFFRALFVIFYEASLGLVYGTSVDLFYGASCSSSFSPLFFGGGSGTQVY